MTLGPARLYVNSSSITRIARGVRAHEVELADALDRPRSSCDSSTGWVTITSRACSPEPSLHDRLDRDAVLAEHLRDVGEHAGLVGDLQVQVEGADDVLRPARSGSGGRGRRGRRRSSR